MVPPPLHGLCGVRLRRHLPVHRPVSRWLWALRNSVQFGSGWDAHMIPVVRGLGGVEGCSGPEMPRKSRRERGSCWQFMGPDKDLSPLQPCLCVSDLEEAQGGTWWGWGCAFLISGWDEGSGDLDGPAPCVGQEVHETAPYIKGQLGWAPACSQTLAVVLASSGI